MVGLEGLRLCRPEGLLRIIWLKDVIHGRKQRGIDEQDHREQRTLVVPYYPIFQVKQVIKLLVLN